MSFSIDQAFVKQYEREVHLAFQRKGSILRGTVRTRTGVRGATVTFQKVAKGMSTSKGRHSVITPMNLAHTNVEATMTDWYTGEWIDKLDELKINHDERAVVTESAAAAQGRRTDQIIIDAMLTATNSTAITLTTQASVRNSLLEAVEDLKERDVPFDGDIWGVIPPSLYSALMTIDQFVSSDYTGSDLPFKNPAMGKVHTWLGVHWMSFTGLPLATNTRTGAIYHKSAVGHAIAQDVQADIQFYNTNMAWFAATSLSMGAVLIDNDGVQELTIDESTALPVA